MRNKKLWRVIMAYMCIQYTAFPAVEAMGDTEKMQLEEQKMESESVLEEVIVEPEVEEAESEEAISELEPEEAEVEEAEVEEAESEEEIWEPEAEEVKLEEVESEEEILEPEVDLEKSLSEGEAREEPISDTEPEEAQEKVISEPAFYESVEEKPVAESDSIYQHPMEHMEQPTEAILPEITLVNISSATASTESLKPEIVIRGESLTPQKLQIVLMDEKGNTVEKPALFIREGESLICKMDEITEDGRYTLRITGEDEAGNWLEKTCTFTVNKNGSEFAYDDTLQHISKTNRFSPAIHIRNYDDVKIISCMVNGKEAEYSWDGEYVVISSGSIVEGKNAITLETKDGAGNVSSMKPWEFVVTQEEEEEEMLSGRSEQKEEHARYLKLTDILWMIGRKLLSI